MPLQPSALSHATAASSAGGPGDAREIGAVAGVCGEGGEAWGVLRVHEVVRRQRRVPVQRCKHPPPRLPPGRRQPERATEQRAVPVEQQLHVGPLPQRREAARRGGRGAEGADAVGIDAEGLEADGAAGEAALVVHEVAGVYVARPAAWSRRT
jgi:hypothetical protein